MKQGLIRAFGTQGTQFTKQEPRVHMFTKQEPRVHGLLNRNQGTQFIKQEPRVHSLLNRNPEYTVY